MPVLQGSCLCQGVRYTLASPPRFINLCHCSLCRKLSGSAFGSFLHADGRGLRWLAGEALVRRYESSPGNWRAFCTACGSLLPVLEDGGRHAIIPAGTLDDDPGLQPLVHIHCASKAPWYDLPADGLPRFDAFPPPTFWPAGPDDDPAA
ncbi:GFA family protein [Pelomonas sp. APW6]|uniref:GFA family protein n=1 Tax=Roseateles subflavus TaxID=3053353 RepID=A0ABT7LFB9_9BURK|nr:GFA family protein [Pelomonas sp. APW6]MDL5031547.1 GFA family protein [Pelomonas sp. APW6]